MRKWGDEGMRNDTASGRFGVLGPFRICRLLRTHFNDGTRIWNGDAADAAGS